VLCAVEGTLECWRCSGTKHEGELFYRFSIFPFSFFGRGFFFFYSRVFFCRG
jgi:hypothetical protein